MLNSVSHHPYLRVELSNTLDWSHPIDSKVNKSNHILGFLLKKIGNCPESYKELACQGTTSCGICKSGMGSLFGQAYTATWSCSTANCTICKHLLGVNTWNCQKIIKWSGLASPSKMKGNCSSHSTIAIHKAIHGESSMEIPSYTKTQPTIKILTQGYLIN